MQLNTDNGGGGDRGGCFAPPSVRQEYTSLKALTLSFSHFSLLCSPARARSWAGGSCLVRLETGRCVPRERGRGPSGGSSPRGGLRQSDVAEGN